MVISGVRWFLRCMTFSSWKTLKPGKTDSKKKRKIGDHLALCYSIVCMHNKNYTSKFYIRRKGVHPFDFQVKILEVSPFNQVFFFQKKGDIIVCNTRSNMGYYFLLGH